MNKREQKQEDNIIDALLIILIGLNAYVLYVMIISQLVLWVTK